MNIFLNPKLRLVLLLLDSRRVPNEDDVMMFNYLLENKNINYYLVMTKCDKLNQKEKAAIKKNLALKFNQIDESKIIYTSAKNKENIELLKEKIAKIVID